MTGVIGAVTRRGGHAGDRVHGGHRAALAEDRVRVVAVEGLDRRTVRLGDEELVAVRVGPAVRHAEEPRAVVLRAGPHLVGDAVARVARAVPLRVAALDHEALDDAVERRPVVRRPVRPGVRVRVEPGALAGREADEVGDRVRRLVVVESTGHLPHRGVDRRRERAGPAEALRGVGEGKLAAQRVGTCARGGRRRHRTRRGHSGRGGGRLRGRRGGGWRARRSVLGGRLGDGLRAAAGRGTSSRGREERQESQSRDRHRRVTNGLGARERREHGRSRPTSSTDKENGTAQGPGGGRASLRDADRGLCGALATASGSDSRPKYEVSARRPPVRPCTNEIRLAEVKSAGVRRGGYGPRTGGLFQGACALRCSRPPALPRRAAPG